MSDIIHDPDLQNKARRATEILSENLHFVANEPSLAFYRIQEHVRKSVPPMIEKRIQVQKLQKDLQGHYYDVEYALGAVNSIKNSEKSLNNIQEQLKSALFLSQQIKYEHTRRNNTKKDSMYKRLSAHLTTTLDLPELPEAIRDTANRVESMMQSARHSNIY
ncbi:BLOC-1-related complex subunit 8 homolog [Daktulosphaira vitifoliae]|uniref:BLOC-1-related complex subunit 8 homolog n=1 Tax=Daktulosphaira vitifoliae TaxID=58002 RepID=UPI0021A9A628|nr:BLOC-1-related complex subunit 8 homolog [Daktulosphaira vitifoliae]